MTSGLPSLISASSIREPRCWAKRWLCAVLVGVRVIGRHGPRQASRKQAPRVTICAHVEHAISGYGRNVDDELTQSLKERTLESLDFDYVVERLREHCVTVASQRLTEDYGELMASTPEEANDLYAEVLEMSALDDADLTLNTSMDIEQLVDDCASGCLLEAVQLSTIADVVAELATLRNGLDAAVAKGAQLPKLTALSDRIELPDDLLDAMLGAFAGEQLSETKFPELMEMKNKMQELETESAVTLNRVLASGKYNRYLMDDGYSVIGGRYTLSVRGEHKGKVGETIDESRSGATAYVVPSELVGLGNELAGLQKELKFVERRIFGRMCVEISRAREDLKRCLEAAGRIDLARARLFLGEDMEGEIPEVGREGVIAARLARNPCLLLRGGINVVGYRLEFDASCLALMLSGPNAGGKTIVLKTCGLLALLARCGIPVPAGESPRVDFFDVVMADVGDMQTVAGDLSTYSAHLVAARLMLNCSEDSGQHALVMFDEAGSGTDPAQGAALARALCEQFIAFGSRLVATTHSMQLKNWALGHPHVEIAAMEYRGGKPTYRLLKNEIGESHAVETARRLELPQSLVSRAEELLSEDERSLLALRRKADSLQVDLVAKVAKAEEQEKKATAAEKQAKALSTSLAAKEEELRTKELELGMREQRLQTQLLTEHERRVAAHEEKLQQLLASLQKKGAAGDKLQIVGDAIDNLRVEQDKTSEAVRKAQEAAAKIPGTLSSEDRLSMGDTVMVLSQSPWYGFKGRVQSIQSLGKTVDVNVRLNSGKTLQVAKTELGLVTAASAPRPVIKKKPKTDKSKPLRDYSQMASF